MCKFLLKCHLREPSVSGTIILFLYFILMSYSLYSYYQATAEANNLAAVANSKDLYTKEMEAVSGVKRHKTIY